MKCIVTFVAIFLMPVIIKADDHLKALHFLYCYCIVCEMTTGDIGAKNAALELMNTDSKSADFIGCFWRQKAQHSNQFAVTNLEQTFEIEFKQANGKEAKEAEAKKRFEEGMNMNHMIYYYDHFEEIKKMIQMRLDVAGANEALGLPQPGVKDP